MNPGNFLAELKRRNVYRAAVAYGVVAWFLTQLTTQVFPIFEIPNGAIRLVVVALAIGFPIAMLLAWIYELTPKGIVRTDEIDPREVRSIQRSAGRLLDFVIIGVLLLAIALLVYERRSTRTAVGDSIPDKSIAVLPFKPLLPENRDPVLEMGMADTLIIKLSNSGKMNVISLTSVRQYGDLDQDPRAAGRKLGVNSVLEGNVQKSGDRLRVTVRLIKVADGSSLWAGTFDEKFTDVFTVQDTIAKKVADALALRLSGEEEERLTKRYTENIEAYQFYLTGRYQSNKLTPPEVTKSIGFFQQAIEADPGYALAYFGLAEAYRTLTITGDRPPKELFPLAKAAAIKAVQIDESLAEPHASLAFIHMWFDWDWVGAEKEARRAIALNPNSAFAHYAWAHVLSNLGRHQEAIAEAARARELDPVSLLFNAREGAVFYHAGRNDEARERLQKTLELDPNFWAAHLWLGHVYVEKKNYPEAIAEFTKARDFSRGNSQTIAMIGYVSALAGDTAKARAILGELKSRSAHEYVPPYNIAVVHLALVEQDEAFAWLEKAYEEHDVLVSFLKIDPKWDLFRSDPRFVAILERIGLH